MSALDRAYQNMTDAQAMSFAPPGGEPAWDDASTEDTDRTVDTDEDLSDQEETIDWAPTDRKLPGRGEE